MPWNLLLLPLLGGYLLIRQTHLLRFRYQPFDGYRLLLASAFHGVWLAALSSALCAFVIRFSWGCTLQSSLSGVWPFDYVGVAAGALLLPLAIAPVVNWMVDKDEAKARILEECSDFLMGLFDHSAVTGSPILVTTANRKVYVAIVLDAPNLERSEKDYVALLPLWSGYRRADDLRACFVTRFDKLYLEGNVDIGEFGLVVPLSQIVSAQRFNLEVYEANFTEQSEPRALSLEGTSSSDREEL